MSQIAWIVRSGNERKGFEDYEAMDALCEFFRLVAERPTTAEGSTVELVYHPEEV